MSENLLLLDESASREEKYQNLVPQIKALISGEKDLIANMANISAALKQTFDFFWVGFYIVRNEELVLGPFQGPIACTRIKYGRGVCGTAWQQKMSIVVPDVEAFPGHIACSSESKSEIVVPIFDQGDVVAILDIDSDSLNDFGNVDALYLEEVTALLFDK